MLTGFTIGLTLGVTLTVTAARQWPEIEMWLMAIKEAVMWWRWQDA